MVSSHYIPRARLYRHEMISRYIDDGYRPIPLYGAHLGCKCDNKRCAECDQCFGKVPRDRNWADRRPYSIEDFRPDDNVGLAMGRQENGQWLVAIDFDMAANYRPNRYFPATRRVISGRGFHLYYEVPPDTFLGNWHNFGEFPTPSSKPFEGTGKLDVRYCRGIICAPPSLHKNGMEYIIADERQPQQLPYETLDMLKNMRKKIHPNVETPYRWSHVPSHKGKKP